MPLAARSESRGEGVVARKATAPRSRAARRRSGRSSGRVARAVPSPESAHARRISSSPTGSAWPVSVPASQPSSLRHDAGRSGGLCSLHAPQPIPANDAAVGDSGGRNTTSPPRSTNLSTSVARSPSGIGACQRRSATSSSPIPKASSTATMSTAAVRSLSGGIRATSSSAPPARGSSATITVRRVGAFPKVK